MTRVREQLPLVKSLEETIDLWPSLTKKQKLGAAAASIVTVSGPILRAFTESRQGLSTETDTKQRILAMLIDSRDKLDGTIAKTTGGVTPLGKELDPLMDKVDFALQEILQVRRGQLAVGHVATRLARDAAVTLVRSHVHAVTHGEVTVAAGWHGKASTLMRTVSLRATGLLPNSGLEMLHQTTATSAILLSGAKNIHDLLAAKSRWQDSSRNFEREETP